MRVFDDSSFTKIPFEANVTVAGYDSIVQKLTYNYINFDSGRVKKEALVIMKKQKPIIKSPQITLAAGETKSFPLSDFVLDPDFIRNDMTIQISNSNPTGLNLSISNGNLLMTATNCYAGNTSFSIRATHDWLIETNTVNVTINASTAPKLTANSATTFCQGNSLGITSNVSGVNQWFKDGVVISGSTGSVLNVNTSGVYTAKVTINGCQTIASNAIPVTVNAIPATPTISAASATTFCTGGLVSLNSNASNGNNWYKDGVEITGSTGSVLNVNTSGLYTAKVTLNGCQTVASNSIPVTVNAIPTTPIIFAASATTFCNGGLVSLNSNAENGNTWYKDGVVINGLNGTSLNVITSGNYTTKTILNNCQSSFSNSITVTVNPYPAQSSIISGNDTVLLAQTLNYSINPIAFASNTNWQLSGGGNIISGQNTNALTIYWTTAGKYILTVYGINNCGIGLVQSKSITVPLLTSIVNPDDQFQIKVVPNPSPGEFYLSAKGLLNKNLKMDVLNIHGQLIYQSDQRVLQNDFYSKIDLSNVSNGFYYIKITTGNKVYLRKIIKAN